MTEYMPTVPYYRLAANERAGLEAEKAAILKRNADPGTHWVDRVRDEARLGEIERLLKTDVLARRPTQRPAPPRQAQHQAPSGEPTHAIVAAPGFRAIAEHPDGSGAILIIEDRG